MTRLQQKVKRWAALLTGNMIPHHLRFRADLREIPAFAHRHGRGWRKFLRLGLHHLRASLAVQACC